jgi:FkbM family methyltransferase
VTLPARLENLRKAGFDPKRIIDAGAYRGEWTQTIHPIFPKALILMIEPQPASSGNLQRLCAENSNFRFRKALLGDAKKRVRFFLQDSNSGIVPDSYVEIPGDKFCEMQTETLAEIATSEGFDPCDLLKLDLQGHELAALAGAGNLFGRIEVIFMEVSWLRIGEVPLIDEVIETLRGRGYRLYDILGFNYRPLDRALWQTDLIFVRENSSLLANEKRWS